MIKSSHPNLIPAACDITSSLGVDIHRQADALHGQCTRCRACISSCAFLQKNGTPGDIAASVMAGDSAVDPFECSLCNLCTAVCPAQITPGAFFLEMRRQVAAHGKLPIRRYSSILKYERRGSSRLFSWYGLPSGCDTVFFPGCTLSGTRSEATWQLYQQLNASIPHLGVVLDCCHKLSHDLGRQQFFLNWFEDMRDWLIRHGVRHMVVACPNCYKVFHGYGQGLGVRTAWEVLAATKNASAFSLLPGGLITVHDPCPLRDHDEVHQAVRTLLLRLGLKVREMRHSGKRTICCGEGGSVGIVNPEMAANWGALRKREAGEDLVLTYCGGCAGFLAKAGIRVVHLADLLVNPGKALKGKASVSRAPRTYLHRIKLKRKMQAALQIGHEQSQ